MAKRPRLIVPSVLPWDAMSRVMTAYAEECLAIIGRPGHPKRDEWRREAKRACKAAVRFQNLHQKDPCEPMVWPREED